MHTCNHYTELIAGNSQTFWQCPSYLCKQGLSQGLSELGQLTISKYQAVGKLYCYINVYNSCDMKVYKTNFGYNNMGKVGANVYVHEIKLKG